jgi:hypothetical protein
MKNKPNGLAAVLSVALGRHWLHLHPDIRARFTLAPGAQAQTFTGTMNTIERSPAGWLIARLIAFLHVLPAVRARDVPFEFNLSPAPAVAGGWIKQRLYRFAGGPFEFRSVMHIAANGDLVEQFPYGLGMTIRLSAEGDHGERLYFRDDGYFLRIGAWRLPLPRWLGVGRFTLLHRNIDRDRFVVEISIDHPLLGRLFYQCGAFNQAEATQKLNAGAAAAPDRARKAARDNGYCPSATCDVAAHRRRPAAPAIGRARPDY